MRGLFIGCAGLASAFGAVAMPSAPAGAAVYTDRAAFNAALGAHSFIDFENVVGTPGYPADYGNGTGHVGRVGGITVSGLHFRGVGAGDETFIIGPGALRYSMGSFNALGGFRQMVITLAGGVTAFGFDVGQPNSWTTSDGAPLTFTIAVRPVGGALAPVATQVGEQGPNFFGYTGAAFDQVQVTGNFGYYVYFDNAAFGDMRTTAAIPEPATWAMLIAGFGLVGSVARRRRASASVLA